MKRCRILASATTAAASALPSRAVLARRFASKSAELPLSSLTAISGIDGRCVQKIAGGAPARRGPWTVHCWTHECAAGCCAASRKRARRALEQCPQLLLTPPPLPHPRYARQTAELRPVFSEYALIKHRVHVEVEWLKAMAANKVRACNNPPSFPSPLPRTHIHPLLSSPPLVHPQGIPEVPALSPEALSALDGIVSGFDVASAQRVKAIESTTNHDVKAVEYFLKEKFAGE
jgi:hypothetical protein